MAALLFGNQQFPQNRRYEGVVFAAAAKPTAAIAAKRWSRDPPPKPRSVMAVAGNLLDPVDQLA
ncbi:MAG: hypothetical protein EOP84_23455 [Verrucomicrobiaceae bacterium]|nr:MAG: hypothetical protein EOP84_23455 [Verrucomicrobiaceae bacterium]